MSSADNGRAAAAGPVDTLSAMGYIHDRVSHRQAFAEYGMSDPLKVTFQPEGRTVHVMKGTLLLAAAAEAGIGLSTPCAGKGSCGKCRVQISMGAPAATEECRKLLSAEEIEKGMRLACQIHVAGDMVVNVPVGTRVFAQKILTSGDGQDVPLDPNVKKCFVQVAEPTLEDTRADADRVLAALDGDVRAGLAVLRRIPEALRRSGFALTAVLSDGRLMGVEDGDTTAHLYGAAFDIGTTTVVGMLHDLHTGAGLAVASRANPQVAYGDDVVSRISYTVENADGLDALSDAIRGCLNEILAEMCAGAGVAAEQIYEVTVVGNTTMNHLFLGVPPRFVAQAPYAAAIRRATNVPAERLGLAANPNANVHTFPNIAGFVGGDTVGVVLACDLMNAEDIRLAIDIGTNGEIVIGSRERLVSCSTAAGPALEGARIQFGMRAAEGAIDKLRFGDDVEMNVIGNVPARGICGTALIDAVAELLRTGIVDPRGRLLAPDELPASAPDGLRRRVATREKGNVFVLAEGDACALDEPVVLTQRDIREVQLAKGAIAAGIEIMMKELGVAPDGLAQVYLAGAFGNFIRRSMAKRIGLLPDVPSDRIRFIGNAAGAGARMALLSRACREEAARISERTEYLELGGRADFQSAFMSAMLFPE